MWAGKQIKDANRSHERKMLMLDHIHPFYNPADKLKKKKNLSYIYVSLRPKQNLKSKYF